MMSEPLGMLTDIVAAVTVMFIIPIILCTEIVDSVGTEYARMLTQRLTDDICAHGYLEDARYEAYMYRLNTVTVGSTTEISAETEEYEPVYLDGSFTGNITEYKVRTGTDEILEVVFEKGVCNFRYGDSITVEAILNNGSFVRCTGIVNGSEVAAKR